MVGVKPFYGRRVTITLRLMFWPVHVFNNHCRITCSPVGNDKAPPPVSFCTILYLIAVLATSGFSYIAFFGGDNRSSVRCIYSPLRGSEVKWAALKFITAIWFWNTLCQYLLLLYFRANYSSFYGLPTLNFILSSLLASSKQLCFPKNSRS